MEKEDFSKHINSEDQGERFYPFFDDDKERIKGSGPDWVDWLIFILFATVLVLGVTSCNKPKAETPQQSTSVKVLLNVKYYAADSICYHSINPTINGYFSSSAKEVDFTLPGSGTGNYNTFSAFEQGSITNVDSIYMKIYINGTLTYSQAAIGSVSQQIQY